MTFFAFPLPLPLPYSLPSNRLESIHSGTNIIPPFFPRPPSQFLTLHLTYSPSCCHACNIRVKVSAYFKVEERSIVKIDPTHALSLLNSQSVRPPSPSLGETTPQIAEPRQLQSVTISTALLQLKHTLDRAIFPACQP